MRNILITIEYIGTKYHGWQKQNGLRTVEGEIENALSRIEDADVDINASGRTDVGAHALGQTASFLSSKNLRLDAYLTGANHFLPSDIRLIDVREVPLDFHARYSAKSKTYRYEMYISPRQNVVCNERKFIINDVNVDLMKDACKYFVGSYDFSAFKSMGSSALTNTRTVTDCHIEAKGDNVDLYITASGFLYNMVRIITACIIRVGQGKLDMTEIPRIIASRDRALVKDIVPSYGLYLLDVHY